jgi:hypothetical protein
MPVRIDRLEADIDVQPDRAEAAGGGGALSQGGPPIGMAHQQLKLALRDVIREVLAEEIETFLKMKG